MLFSHVLPTIWAGSSPVIRTKAGTRYFRSQAYNCVYLRCTDPTALPFDTTWYALIVPLASIL